MSRRNKIITLAVLLLIALLVLLFFVFRAIAPTQETPIPEPTEELPNQPVREDNEPTSDEVKQEERVQSASVQSLSKTFTERYGSYSSESDFANLTDVLGLMTASFAAETQAFIDTAQTPTEYYGVTTHVVSITVDSMDEEAGTAAVTVSTQREEAKGSIQNVSVRYQTLRLTFEKEGTEWKVASATWE